MIVVLGNKRVEMSRENFEKTLEKYKSVELDIGTGDGRFVYKNAIINSSTLFVGIDPAEKQLEIYSKKAVRKKLTNTLFVISSVENIPSELFGTATKIHITLPWGTLLENIVKPNDKFLQTLKNLLGKTGDLEIIFGYIPELEPSETKRLSLPDIDENFIKISVIQAFEDFNFHLVNMNELSKKDVGNLETTWAKKLRFGRDRRIYKLAFSKQAS